jgi:hypothetical protein
MGLLDSIKGKILRKKHKYKYKKIGWLEWVR